MWDTLKMLRVDAERLCDAKAHARRCDYDCLQLNDGETTEDFAMRLTTILNDLEMFGDPEDECKAVRKFLPVLPVSTVTWPPLLNLFYISRPCQSRN
jgi:hypothetical protein